MLIPKFKKKTIVYALAIASEINPSEATCYMNRGLSYQDIGDTQRANADFSRAK